MAAKILLTSTVGWASVARLAHGFATASCRVDAHAPANALVFASRYVDSRHVYKPLNPQASLKSAVMAARPDLVVPCDDRAVSHLLKLHNSARAPDIEELVVRSLGNPGSYSTMMSRSGFMARAEALGIRVPASRSIFNPRDLDAFIVESGLPVVLKSDGSWGGEGVVVARSREEARSAFRRLASAPSRLRSLARAAKRRDCHYLRDAAAPRKREITAQAFIPGRPAACAFAAWKGEIVGAIYYDVLVAQGEIGPPNVIRRVACLEMKNAARKVAKHFGLSGIHGLDFLRNDSGAVYLIEINPRATQGSTLPFGPEGDLPATLVSRLGIRAGMRVPIPNDTVAIFPREWQRDPASPWLRSAYHDVPWDDPALLVEVLRGIRVAGCPQIPPADQPVPFRNTVSHGDAPLTVPQRLEA